MFATSLASRTVAGATGAVVRPIKQRTLTCRSQHNRIIWIAFGVSLGITALALMALSTGFGRRILLSTGAAGLLTTSTVAKALPFNLGGEDVRQGEVSHSEEEWGKLLSPSQYYVLRKAGTEPPFTSELNNEKRSGTFTCAGCGAPLFPSTTKFNSGTGWPSFYQPIDGAVKEEKDTSIMFMPRVEVRCKKCEGHLGHVFEDGPRPTGLRYCMNGLALKFVPNESA